MIITIDGPSGTGKSTIAKLLAQKLEFNYCDSGSIYRTIAYGLISYGIDPEDPNELVKFLQTPPFEFRFGKDQPMTILFNNQPIGNEIRAGNITEAASKTALIPEIREYVNNIQKDYGQLNNVIFEGRGLGSATFPQADVKIFLTADIETRAKRRLKDLQDQSISLETMIEKLKIRDQRDSSRELEPLIIPQGAIIIDSSNLTITEVIEKIINGIHNKNPQ